jgi:hypothetical protein
MGERGPCASGLCPGDKHGNAGIGFGLAIGDDGARTGGHCLTGEAQAVGLAAGHGEEKRAGHDLAAVRRQPCNVKGGNVGG